MNKILLRVAFFAVLFSLLPVQAKDATNTVLKPSSVSNASIVQLPSVENFVGHFDNKIEVVFSDIDGTIMKLNKENPQADASQSAKDAANKLYTAKIPLILATGRVYPEAKELAEKIGVKNSYIIAQQGAEIRNPQGKLIYQDAISGREVQTIFDYFEIIKQENHLTSKFVVFVDGKLYSTEPCLLPYNWSNVKFVDSFKNLGNNYASSLICIYETAPEKIRLIQSSLKKKFPKYHIDLSTHCYCDITSATATKGNALKKMSEILGMDLKNAATMGDAENDISMLSLVKSKGGAAFAVANAMPSVKASAGFVTLSVSDGGFARAVDKIIENNALLSH